VNLTAANTSVIGDATQKHQVVVNLRSNAMRAMASGGVLNVVLDHVASAEPAVDDVAAKRLSSLFRALD
jgi:signal transduction histidine kinase